MFFAAIPLELIVMWHPYPWLFGQVGCHVSVIFGESASYISVLIMIAFTFERFTAICYPLRPSLHSSIGRTRCIIVVIWIFSVLLALQWTSFMKLHFLVFGKDKIPESSVCGIVRGAITKTAGVLTAATTFCLFVCPLFVFPVAYKK